MAKQSPILGNWRIVDMDGWDADYIDEEVKAYIRFEPKGVGEFQFGYVSGGIDHRLVERDGLPAVEWSWEGNDTGGGFDEISGRGWAVLDEDGKLRGQIFIHGGDDSAFVAKRKPAKPPKTPKR